MTASFQIQHSAMLLKYSGISFISGAVNHGFFSGERSLWTAAVGIVLFVVGAWMEHRSQDIKTSLWESLGSVPCCLSAWDFLQGVCNISPTHLRAALGSCLWALLFLFWP
jgi:hypothetical protein